MVEYVVSFVVEKIASQLIEEAGSLSRVRGRVEWIEGELRRMQCFLKDADAKQVGDERVKNWVADVRDVAYDVDDVIDTYLCKMAQRRKKAFIRLSRRYPLVLNEPIAHWKVNKKINRIKTKLHEISESRLTYGIENIGRGDGRSFATDRLLEKRRSSSHACEEAAVGLVEDMNILESQLIHGEARLCIISIVGMAGLGKTTLAKKLYNSSNVVKNFDYCAWFYISQEYRPKDTLQNLVKKLTGLPREELENMDKEELEEALLKFLEERKYLIVLDDIWKREVWDDLKPAFPDRKNGSRIVFTTRFKDVALHADQKSPMHEPCLLSDEEGWELLSKKVCLELNAKSSLLPPWSRELGKQIVKKCGGLPLAIIVMGGLLSRRDATFNEWLKVLQSVHWQLVHDPTECAEILALSYSDLPYYLKPCFLYFGLFPEDYEISARRLILLWVAEGFVQPRGHEPLEDVAEDYLEELVSRSMIQVATRKSNGRIKTCCVHDLLRDLSVSKAREERFLDIIYEDVHVSSLKRGRRLAIHLGAPPITENSPNFRSMLCFELCEPFRELRKFKLLQVLDLENVYISRLDSAIGNLIHLRYLGLRGTWLKKLPSSICHLSNLQTLDLRSTMINPIPLATWKMHQLRHLYFNELKEMEVNPPKDASLAKLHTLQGICINYASCIENGLDKLTNLRELGLHGDLLLQEDAVSKWIFNSENLEFLKLRTRVRDGHMTTGAIPKLNFSSHHRLCKLHLNGFMRKLLDAEYFPQNLTELSLKGSFLMEDPMEKLEMLQSLRVLKLKHSAYVGKEMVCSSGGFPQLHFLKLSFLNLVERWRIENGAMSKLRQLEIVECKRLKIVPRGLQPVTTIHKLKLGYMPRDFEMKVQERHGENWYRIEHVPPI